MNEPGRQARNQQMLLELYPTFREPVRELLRKLEAVGFRPRIQQAWRSPEQQLEAYRSGHSKLRFGFHNVTGAQGQKEALAVDLLDDDAPLAPSARYLLYLAACAEELGLATGIRWGLPILMREAVTRAIALKDFDAPVKIGWDPTHVEPTGGTALQAQRGWRPS